MTAALLRRFAHSSSGNGDWNDGAFRCSFPGSRGPAVAAITQRDAVTLDVILMDAGDTTTTAGALQRGVRTTLGLRCDMSRFNAAAATIPWLRDFHGRMRGVRPGRMTSLWEAGVTAIVYQSVSMLAAGAVIERLIERLGLRRSFGEITFTLFPSCEAVASASESGLRATGLSGGKVRAIRAVAAAVMAGEWDEAELDALSTADLCERLASVHGIGPWSAAVIALRGLGRLDVFPLRDSGVLRTIDALSGSRRNATAEALAVLGETRGMLYHYLLLSRLVSRGLLPAGDERGSDHLLRS